MENFPLELFDAESRNTLLDPVGEYGKAVERIYNKYKKHMDDVELKLYDGCRHELHSEINAQEVFEDIYNWIVERVG